MSSDQTEIEYGFLYFPEDDAPIFLSAGVGEEGRDFLRPYEDMPERGSKYELKQRKIGPLEDLTTP